MDLRKKIILLTFIVGVLCEIDYSSLINSTQHLYNIERGGIYPQLNLSDNSINYGNSINDFFNDNGSFKNSTQPNTRPAYTAVNNSSRELKNFLNKTKTAMSSGLCTKEVPTSSLLTNNNNLYVAGNGSDPSLSRIQVCCEGYQRDARIFRKCNPICSDCENGVCTAPNTCTCFPGFVKNFKGKCIPTCPYGCENGVCNSDNTCQCNQGFTPGPNNKFCTFKCKDGFRATGRNGECEAFCSRGCEKGICVAPEQCECLGSGWILDETRSKCNPTCQRSCLNGFCESPNNCGCNSGYMKDIIDPYRCNPVCEPTCENAMCSGPNMCLCYQGYKKDRNERSGNKCVKI